MGQSIGNQTCGEGDEGNRASRVACGGPPCVCCEEDLREENKTMTEIWNRTESHPWDPTELGCCIVHSDWIKNIYTET